VCVGWDVIRWRLSDSSYMGGHVGCLARHGNVAMLDDWGMLFYWPIYGRQWWTAIGAHGFLFHQRLCFT